MKYIVGKVGYVEKDDEDNIISGEGFEGLGVDTSGRRRSLHEHEDDVLTFFHSTEIPAVVEKHMTEENGFYRYDQSTTPTMEELLNSEEWTKAEDIDG